MKIFESSSCEQMVKNLSTVLVMQWRIGCEFTLPGELNRRFIHTTEPLLFDYYSEVIFQEIMEVFRVGFLLSRNCLNRIGNHLPYFLKLKLIILEAETHIHSFIHSFVAV